MLRRRVTWVFVAILAAWIQLLLPVAASSMEQPADSFGIICGRGSATAPDGQQAPAGHDRHHDCCAFCHVYLGAAPVSGRPAFSAFDYPVVSPLRWRLVPAERPRRVARRDRLPRGPPALV